jgi:hypothetical protein
MSELVRYEAARRALAEARRIDEVASIHNKAMAMQVYARQAKDRELVVLATEIRLRSEIRAGEMLREMAARDERHGRGAARWKPQRAKLADLDITRTQSSQWQRFAALPKPEQEARIERATQRAGAVVAAPGRAPAAKQPPPTLIDRCVRSVRMTIRATLRKELPGGAHARLFAALRGALDELEQAAARRREQQNPFKRPITHPADRPSA